MTSPEDADRPAFDLVRFEADAQERAAELTIQVGRLAVIEIPHEAPYASWLQERGAQYYLTDNTRVEVMCETYDQDPEHVISKVRITPPSTEILGHDGQLRRVTLSRYIIYRSFTEDLVAAGEDLIDLDEEPELEDMGRIVFDDLQREQLERQLDPNYRPSELIRAKTAVLVECKLPDKPNFRTEYYSHNMPVDTKLAHMAARHSVGEPVEYSIVEHKSLIAQLAGIDPTLANPQPLDDDFDDSHVWSEC